MTRPIRAPKGGRTARAPEARIKPTTLERIHETMREHGKSFADLLEDTYSGDDTMADIIKEGDKVNIKYNGKWYRLNGKLYVFTVRHTWYTTANGRQYQVKENDDTFSADEIRKVQ